MIKNNLTTEFFEKACFPENNPFKRQAEFNSEGTFLSFISKVNVGSPLVFAKHCFFCFFLLPARCFGSF
ncbi:MAG: hypothetical protein LBE20_04940 [Deltaproteobacteria bacterium]|jgi:hypothetical protein|nr:hypothetical protein [Deltaproteobacteria bacterium]